MDNVQVDILIVGGGLIGISLMKALANNGYTSLLIDKHGFDGKVTFDFDARTLALSSSSVAILRSLQIWPNLEKSATAIEKVHISEQRGFAGLRLQNSKNIPLGYVIEMQQMYQSIYPLLDTKNLLIPAELTNLTTCQDFAKATITHKDCDISLKARLVVAADGADSVVRSLSGLSSKVKHYNQDALIANIGLSRSHQHCAYERFTKNGPLAMLPIKENRAALIWAMPCEMAKRLITVDDSSFLKELQSSFGYRLGRFIQTGVRTSHTLKQVVMPKQIAWPLVFIGNAAHTLHPVAGQGFNLGLRDVAMLVQCIEKYGLNAKMLTLYQSQRLQDQKTTTDLTDGLINLFQSRLPGLALARNLGLALVDNNPFLKNVVTRYTAGFSGITPDLACSSGEYR